MIYYPEPDSHIRDKVRVVLDFSNYATKKELEHATDIASKAEVDKLDINKLINLPNSLNNLETKVDDLYIGTLKTIPVDLKQLRDAVDNEAVRNTKFNTLSK